MTGSVLKWSYNRFIQAFWDLSGYSLLLTMSPCSFCAYCHYNNILTGQFTFYHLLLVVANHADSLDSVCPGYEISVSEFSSTIKVNGTEGEVLTAPLDQLLFHYSSCCNSVQSLIEGFVIGLSDNVKPVPRVYGPISEMNQYRLQQLILVSYYYLTQLIQMNLTMLHNNYFISTDKRTAPMKHFQSGSADIRGGKKSLFCLITNTVSFKYQLLYQVQFLNFVSCPK